MTEHECTNVRVAAMAMADGYEAEIPPDRIATHLASCRDCRLELDQLRAVATLLDSQKRQPRTEHLWTAIDQRLTRASAATASTTWQPFTLLGLLLVGYKLVEMIPDRDFGLLSKLVPIVFIVAAFSYLKVNPFKINTELRLEGGE